MSAVPLRSPAPRIRPDLRKDRRVAPRLDLHLPVRLLDHTGEELSARTINVSSSGLLLDLESRRLHRGVDLVCYVDGLGRIKATIVRRDENGVALVAAGTQLKRDRIADQLTWLWNKDRLGLEEERRADRSASATAGQVLIQTADGRTLQAEVIDMSLVGVALATKGPRPLLGERVKLGNKFGRVARYLPNGFALDFTRV